MGDTEVYAQRAPQRDMVEETIRDRVRAADDEKRRVLAAFDAAAKSGIAGPKIVDLKNFSKHDGTFCATSVMLHHCLRESTFHVVMFICLCLIG